MSEEMMPVVGGVQAQVRTLAVRLTDDMRAQLDVIAQLNSRSVTEEIRVALEAWIDLAKADPKILGRAEVVRAEIEREAQVRRDAIAAIFGSVPPGASETLPVTRRSKLN